MTDSRQRLIEFMGKTGGHLPQHAHLAGSLQRLFLFVQQHVVPLQLPATSANQQHHPDVIERKQQQYDDHAPHRQSVLNKPAFDIQPQLTLLRMLSDVAQQRFYFTGRGGRTPAKRRVLRCIEQYPRDAIGQLVTHYR